MAGLPRGEQDTHRPQNLGTERVTEAGWELAVLASGSSARSRPHASGPGTHGAYYVPPIPTPWPPRHSGL